MDDEWTGWQVYILECSDSTLYTGIALDPDTRLRQHNSGKGSKYTRSRLPLALVYREAVGSRGDALRREAEIKRLSRQEKQQLISSIALEKRGGGATQG
ncbi:MAG: GIY-YIG nuclease family protein [Gammaproteobacteria bacterium]|nr:GIY-YIG nuclease family protein [Gammaproteobacteria bacterium]